MEHNLLTIQYEKILNSVADGVFTIDCDNNITFFNRTLTELLSIGTFRHELFYRLNVVKLMLPPLSNLREEAPPAVGRAFHSEFQCSEGS